MWYFNIKSLGFFILLCFFSCISGEKSPVAMNNQNDNCVFSCDLNQVSVIWSGFKTTEKIKVTGQFKKFKSKKASNNKSFQSVQDLIEGLDFVIDSQSSVSGDPVRDLNLRDAFFRYFVEKFMISGVFGKIQGDSISVSLNLMGQKNFKLGISYTNEVVNIKGSVDLIKQLNANMAFEAIQRKCYDLHKGPDGNSKTWSDVEIHIKAPITTKCD